MNHRRRKQIIVRIAVLGLGLGLAAPTQAGLIPWIYSAIFSPMPPNYYYGYGGYAAPPMMSSPYAAPGACGIAPTSAASSCNSCSVAARPPRIAFCPVLPMACAPMCSPCGPSGCPGGDCSVVNSPTPVDRTSEPAKAKTFAEDAEVPTPVDAEVPEPADTETTPPIDEGFRPRGTEPVQTEAYKPAETVIPQKKPAPTEVPADQDASEDAEKTENAEKAEKAENTEKASEQAKPATETDTPKDQKSTEPPNQDTSNRLPLPSLSFDQKVTWHVVPKRARLPLHARFVTPVVVRSSTDSNTGWSVVSEGAQIVQK